jgi:hypothetical protein
MPAVVGSLVVLSANPLAAFFPARNIAFIAICMQNLRNAPLEAQQGQRFGSNAGGWEESSCEHRRPQTLFTQSLSGYTQNGWALGTNPAFTRATEEQFVWMFNL